MRNLRLAFFPVLIWTLALLAIYGPLAMGVVGLPASDLTTGMYPYAVFQGTELWSGRLPVWSPGSYGGHPFAADPQSAVFYPVRLLTLLFAPAAGPPLHLLVLGRLSPVAGRRVHVRLCSGHHRKREADCWQPSLGAASDQLPPVAADPETVAGYRSPCSACGEQHMRAP